MENQITELLHCEDAINKAVRQITGLAALLETLEISVIEYEIQPEVLETMSMVLRAISDNLGNAASCIHCIRKAVHCDMPE